MMVYAGVLDCACVVLIACLSGCVCVCVRVVVWSVLCWLFVRVSLYVFMHVCIAVVCVDCVVWL